MKTNIVIIALWIAFSGIAAAQTNSMAMTTNAVAAKASAPATNEIVTADGATYEDAKVLRAEPNGLTISYTPEGGGIGVIKIPFDVLPGDLQTNYGYNSEKAAKYQEEQLKAVGQWREQWIAAEAAARAKRDAEEKAAEDEAAAKKAAETAAAEATNSIPTNSIPTNDVPPPPPQGGGY